MKIKTRFYKKNDHDAGGGVLALIQRNGPTY